ncbi:cytochrome P450 [Coprinopsis cinerea AmutBmut pab1-1]|nr:cytochrome P450 [Coprinopsis cinerea AmutBmut pab1-1]
MTVRFSAKALSDNPWIVALFGGALVLYIGRRLRRPKLATDTPLPPGPKGLPLVGNAFQIPLQEPRRVYKEWAEQYGDVIYLRAISQPIVVLDSMSAIQELLIKRAANYSDRVESPVTALMGGE